MVCQLATGVVSELWNCGVGLSFVLNKSGNLCVTGHSVNGSYIYQYRQKETNKPIALLDNRATIVTTILSLQIQIFMTRKIDEIKNTRGQHSWMLKELYHIALAYKGTVVAKSKNVFMPSWKPKGTIIFMPSFTTYKMRFWGKQQTHILQSFKRQ